MNRIHLREQASPSSTGATPTFAGSLARSRDANGLDPCFFVPLHYEPNYAYPLLVWLHGPDDDPTQLKRVMPHISLRNYVAVAPGGGNLQPHDGAPGAVRLSWPQRAEGLATAIEQVEECVARARQRFHIAERRVFLAGYDSGGSMALRLGFAVPEMFAGVASLGGPFPYGQHSLAHLHRLRRLPVMVAQGRDSRAYPIRGLCDELRLYHAAGMSLTVRQYPCGQELTTQMLSDLNRWLMELVTGVDGSSSSAGEYGIAEGLN